MRKKWLKYEVAVITILLIILAIVAVNRRPQEETQRAEATQMDPLEELEIYKGQYDEQRILLPDTSKREAKKIAKEIGAEVRMTEDGKFAALYLPEGTDIQRVYENEAYEKYLEKMEPDYYGEVCSTKQSGEVDKVPFADMSSYINLGDSWSKTKGKGSTVAIIDTGVDTDNTYIASKISNKSFNASEGKVVSDFDLSVIEAAADDNHGTNTAAVIAGKYDESLGIGGIAPEAELVIIKIEPDEEGRISSSDVIFGIAYAIEKDVDIINMSFNFETEVNPFEKYTQLAVDSDIICVAAAGNSGTSVAVWPAADENVIGVGAVKLNDGKESGGYWATSSFGSYEVAEKEDFILTDNSNYGVNVDIVAPEGMLVPVQNTQGEIFVKQYGDTSCSSAVVAGSLALYNAKNQHQEYSYVKEVLYAAGKDIGALGIDWYYACGLVDVNALVVEEKGTITLDFLTAEFEPETHVFVRGHTLQDMFEPERNYQVFDGWYSDIHLEDEYDNLTEELYDDLTVYASWVNEDDTEPYTYVVKDDGTAEITGYRGKRRYLTVPGVIDGYTVTSIGEKAFEGNRKIKRVNLPESLKSIEKSAFSNMASLRSVEIPENVTKIGEHAFEASAITTIIFAEGSRLQTVGDYAFAKLGIRRIDLPGEMTSINATAFSQDSGLKEVYVEEGNGLYDADGAALYGEIGKDRVLVYYAAGRSGEYIVDSNTQVIGASAFAASRVTAVTLPDSLEKLGESAFAGTNIKEIIIPDKVTDIPKYCFKNTDLESAYLGEAVEVIDDEAFHNCNGLTDVTVASADSILKIGILAFGYTAIPEIDFIGSSIEILGQGAFFGCNNLTEVQLPASLKTLGIQVFEQCGNLQEVRFSDNNQITSIPYRAFNNCPSLTTITLPEGVVELGEKCFASTGLENVFVSSTIRSIGNGVFANCMDLQEIQVADDNKTFKSIEGVLYALDGNREKLNVLHTYPAGRNGETFEIPEIVETIGKEAFVGAVNLEKVIFTDNVITVEKWAFASCINLTSVEFNKGLLAIEEGAFRETGLVSVVFNEELEKLGKASFAQCNNLEQVIFNNKLTLIGDEAFGYNIKLRNVQFKEGLIEIGKGAFANCFKLPKISFPDTLQTIGTYAFAGCSSLGDVTITKNVVSIGAYAFRNDPYIKTFTFVEDCKISRLNFAALAGTGIRNITIPTTITSMGQEVFEGCTDLSTVTFAENSKLTALAAWTFDGSGVDSIVFSEGSLLEHIQAKALSKVTTLKTLDVTQCLKLKNIDNYAFEYCKSLSDFTVPENVEQIGRYAFYGCDSLKTLVMPEKMDFIGRYAFASIPDITVYFNAPAMPANLQEYWDYGIKGYYLGKGEVYTSGDWTYTLLSNDTAALVGYTGTDEEVTVEQVDGYDVSIIGANLLTKDSTIQSLTLPDTVTTICAKAFDGAKNLTSVNIPASVTFIGDYAFQKTGLTHVDFAEGIQIKMIPAYAFAYCTGLTTVEIPASVTDIKTYAFDESGLTEIVFAEGSKLNYIGKFAFAETKLSELTLPDKVTKIDDHAFEGIEKLQSVEFGTEEVELRGYAFFSTGLTELSLPCNIKYVGEYCFAYCENLSVIEVDEENPYYASEEGILFNKAGTKLLVSPAGKTGSYSIPDKTEVLAAGAFEGSKMTSIKIGDNSNLRTLGLKAFYDCKNITSMYIPENIQSIDYYAFAYCTGLETLEISEKCQLTGIYEGAFYGCEALKSIRIPRTLVEIGEYAFYGCDALETVVNEVENVLEGIYDYAFAYCSSLKHFTLTEGLKDIGVQAFRGTALTEVTIPGSILEIGEKCFQGCSDLVNMTITKSNMLEFIGLAELFGLIEDIPVTDLQILEGSHIPNAAFANCKSLVNVSLPDNLTEIGESAFSDCTALAAISSLTKVTELGVNAFKNCTSLIKVEGLGELTTIEAHTFYNCSSLSSVEGLSKVTEVKAAAFYNCKSLEQVDSLTDVETFGDSCFNNCQSLSAINLDKAVSIESAAFRFCSLSEVELPVTLKSLGSYAFSDNPMLKDIVIPDGCLMNAKISAYAFSSTAIEKVEIGEGIVGISDRAFTKCSNLKKISLPDSLIEISDRAFYRSSKLSEINWGTGLQKIGQRAFSETALRVAAIPDGVTSVGEYCFDITQLKAVYVPASVTSVNAFVGAAYKVADVYFEADEMPADAYIPSGITTYFASGKYLKDGDYSCLKSDKGVTLIDYAGTETNLELDEIGGEPIWMIGNNCFRSAKIESIKGLANVERIGDYAFYDTTYLSSIDFGNKLTYIGINAFWRSGLLEADLSKTKLTEINEETFFQCGMLNSLLLPDTLQVIGRAAFQETPLEQMEQLVIPDSVKIIKACAFMTTGLASVKMNGVETIEGAAFYRCSSLKDVQMNSLVYLEGNGNFANCGLRIIELPDTLKKVSKEAFTGCGTVIVPKDIEEISERAFFNCYNVYFKAEELPEKTGTGWDEAVTNIVFGYVDGGIDEDTQLEYIQTSDGLVVIRYHGTAKDLIIDKINDAPITKINGEVFWGDKNLETVTIADSVNEIGVGAFAYCKNLKSVKLSENLSVIDEAMFSQCFKLTEVTLPDNLIEIKYNAFSECSQLKDIVIPEGVVKIGQRAFGYCYELEEINLPSTLEILEGGAFHDSGLTKVVIADDANLKEIGAQAFYNTDLTDIFIPDSVEKIGDSAFANTKIEECVIPDSVTQIGASAFWGCQNLKEVTMSESVSEIADSLFYECGNLEKINIPEIVKTIGKDAFTGTKVFEEVDYIAYVANCAIECTDKTQESYSIREGTTVLCSNLFENCAEAKGIIIPEGIMNIPEYTFSGCVNLENVDLPDTLQSIGKNAFANCSAIKSFTLSENVEHIVAGALYGMNNLETLYLPLNGKITIASLFNSSIPVTLKKIVDTGDMTNVPDQMFADCSNIEYIQLNNSITSIGQKAFWKCSSLKEINMPENLKIIHSYAFRECSGLKEIKLPDGLKTIESHAFEGCEGLKEVVIPDSVETLADGIFYACNNIESLTIPTFVGVTTPANCLIKRLIGDVVKTVTISGNITEIPAYAFTGCKNLETVIMSDNIETVGYLAFSGCNLKKIVWSKQLRIIEDYAFENMYFNGNLAVPEGVEKIGRSSFSSNTYEYVVLPSTLIRADTTPKAEEELRIYSKNQAVSAFFGGLNGTMPTKRLVLPNMKNDITKDWPEKLSKLMGNAPNLESVLLLDTVEMVTEDAFDGYSGITIYCHEDAASTPWPKGWNNGNTVYYKDKWRDITFWADEQLLSTCTQAIGDPIKIPAKALREKADDKQNTYSFVGWDINGDGKADQLLGTTMRNMITANAIYSVLPLNKMVEIEAPEAVAGNDGSMQINAVSEETGAEKTVASITAENVDSISGKDVVVETNLGNVAFDSAATAKINEVAGGNAIELSIENVDNDLLSFSMESDSLYNLDLTANGETIVFGEDTKEDGMATITVPHKVNNPNNLKVYYIDESGLETEVPSTYNKEDKTVSFETYHFSMYRITTGEDSCTEHVFENWIVDKEATCEEDGSQSSQCSQCGEVMTETIETLGHDYEAEFTVDKEATETEAGSKSRHCKRCEAKTDVTVIPKLEQLANPFVDIYKSDYYYDAVLWAVENNITQGKDATHFQPKENCTRAQVVTFLWRAAGKPEPKSLDNPFTDVSSNKFYYKAVLWAVEQGITTGRTSTTFQPDGVCTRSQVVTFLWRAEGKPEPTSLNNPFTDVKTNAYYYKAVLWAVEEGITTGKSATTFLPDGYCKREQIVTFLYRYMGD